MITLGITGSIGAGKSTVSGMLRTTLIPVFEADVAVHELLNVKGEAVASVSHYFPDAVKYDAQHQPFIDRKILSKALADDEKLQMLEDILHPMVFAKAEQFKQAGLKNGDRLIAFDIPLLFETSMEDMVDVVLCISADEAVRKQRVMTRPGMTDEKWEQIVARQMPDAEKRQRSHIVLETHGTLMETEQRLHMMVANILAKKVPPFV